MSTGRCRDKYTFHAFVIEDIIKAGRCYYTLEFALDEPCLVFTGHTDVFQRHLQVVKHGVEVGQAVLTQADEGVLATVGLVEVALGAHPLVAVDELLYHDCRSL